MSEALSSIAGDGKRYAFVGVPCFVKAISLLMRQDARLAEQIRFRVGLVCGHLKSAAFAECLSWQIGVQPEELAAVDFRVKDPVHPTHRYRFGAKATHEEDRRDPPTSQTIAGYWGSRKNGMSGKR